MADYYAAAILKLNPSGPYLLGGYCSGALLAFEIAQRLLAQKKSIHLLIMVDQSLPYVYTGNIAFLPFDGNPLIDDISRLSQSDILKEYYPGGWTLDIVQSKHYPELYYMSAMVVAERIEARINNRVENKAIEPLADTAKQCHIEAVFQEQSADQIIFMMGISNRSQNLWPAGQISIIYHWLSNLGRAILYAENKVTIDVAVAPGQTCSFLYHVNKLNESAEAILKFSLVDNFGTWFETEHNIVITREIHSYNSPILDLASIDQLEEQGEMTQAIQHYYQYLHAHEHDAAKVSIKLAKAVRQARGAQNAQEINEQALTKCVDDQDKAQLHQNLAENYISLNNFDQAVVHARKALQINHHDYLSSCYVGICHAHNKKYSKASQIFKNIMRKLNGNYPENILYNISSFVEIVNSHNSMEAHKYVNTFAKKLLNNNTYKIINYYIYANYLASTGRGHEAEQIVLESIEVYPYLTLGYEILCSLYIEQKQFDKAIIMKNKICQIKPFSLEQHKQLLALLMHEQCLQEASDLQKKLDKLNLYDWPKPL